MIIAPSRFPIGALYILTQGSTVKYKALEEHKHRPDRLVAQVSGASFEQEVKLNWFNVKSPLNLNSGDEYKFLSPRMQSLFF